MEYSAFYGGYNPHEICLMTLNSFAKTAKGRDVLTPPILHNIFEMYSVFGTERRIEMLWQLGLTGRVNEEGFVALENRE